jgi:hypothetical protein
MIVEGNRAGAMRSQTVAEQKFMIGERTDNDGATIRP